MHASKGLLALLSRLSGEAIWRHARLPKTHVAACESAPTASPTLPGFLILARRRGVRYSTQMMARMTPTSRDFGAVKSAVNHRWYCVLVHSEIGFEKQFQRVTEDQVATIQLRQKLRTAKRRYCQAKGFWFARRPSLATVKEPSRYGAAQNDSAGQNLSANCGRLAILRQLGGASELGE